jgi:hypothetical protein
MGMSKTVVKEKSSKSMHAYGMMARLQEEQMNFTGESSPWSQACYNAY